MKNDYIGSIIALILVVFLLLVTPIYYMGIIDTGRSGYQVLYETRQLVDTVIDTHKITEDMLADYNLALAAQSTLYKATIIREMKVTNPNPLNSGETYTTYIVVDDISEWKSGDQITVTVEPVGIGMAASIARNLLGFSVSENTIRLSGRVR